MTTTTFAGTSNTDWDNVANWDAGVPNATLDAVINADCIMDNGGLCKSLTVNATKYLDCSGQDLEVRSGMTDVYGILSSSTGEMKFWEGTTTGWGLQVRNGGKFHGGTGVHYMGSLTAYNNSSAICTLTSGITYMSGHYDALRIILQGDTSTWDPNGGTVIILAGSAGGKIGPGSGGAVSDFYNLTIAMGAGDSCSQYSAGMIVNGDFWVSGGTWDSNDSGGTKTFIVTGTTTIGTDDASAVDEATFITQETPVDLQGTNGGSPGLEMLAGGTFNGVGNANHTMGSVKAAATTYNSKIYFTSGTTTVNEEYTGNYAFVVFSTSDVNFYHGNGTVEITTPTYAYMYSYEPFYNLIINHAGAGGNAIALSNGVPLAVDNDLTLSDGKFLTNLENITVNGDCYVNNDGHDFDARGGDLTVLGQFTLCDGTTYIAGEHPSYPGYFSGDNIFGVISLSGTSTMTATTAVTYLTGSAGSTNQEGFTWTPFYQRAGATFNHNNGTFHNKNTQGYIGYGPGGWGPFYNYIQDLTANGSHTLNTNLICENDLTISGTATLYGGVWGLRNESGYAMHASGNLTLLAGAGMGGLAYNNDTDMVTRGNIIMHTGSILQTATGSTAPYWEVGGGLFNNGGYVY